MLSEGAMPKRRNGICGTLMDLPIFKVKDDTFSEKRRNAMQKTSAFAI